jgi:hypothetical protein
LKGVSHLMMLIIVFWSSPPGSTNGVLRSEK